MRRRGAGGTRPLRAPGRDSRRRAPGSALPRRPPAADQADASGTNDVFVVHFDAGTRIQLADVAFEAGELRDARRRGAVGAGALERAPSEEIEVVVDGFGALGGR